MTDIKLRSKRLKALVFLLIRACSYFFLSSYFPVFCTSSSLLRKLIAQGKFDVKFKNLIKLDCKRFVSNSSCARCLWGVEN